MLTVDDLYVVTREGRASFKLVQSLMSTYRVRWAVSGAVRVRYLPGFRALWQARVLLCELRDPQVGSLSARLRGGAVDSLVVLFSSDDFTELRANLVTKLVSWKTTGTRISVATGCWRQDTVKASWRAGGVGKVPS